MEGVSRTCGRTPCDLILRDMTDKDARWTYSLQYYMKKKEVEKVGEFSGPPAIALDPVRVLYLRMGS